jgi:hypothetical protein
MVKETLKARVYVAAAAAATTAVAVYALAAPLHHGD